MENLSKKALVLTARKFGLRVEDVKYIFKLYTAMVRENFENLDYTKVLTDGGVVKLPGAYGIVGLRTDILIASYVREGAIPKYHNPKLDELALNKMENLNTINNLPYDRRYKTELDDVLPPVRAGLFGYVNKLEKYEHNKDEKGEH